MKVRLTLTGGLLTLLFTVLPTAATGSGYTVTSTGVLPGKEDSSATGLSSNGYVTGTSGSRPFIWTPAGIQGLEAGSNTVVHAAGGNRGADVAGDNWRGGIGTTDAIVWPAAGKQVKIGAGRSLAINDARQITGYLASSTGPRVFLAQLLSSGRVKTTDLGAGRGLAISPKGVIAGSVGSGADTTAFLWRPTTENGTAGIRENLELGATAEAYGVNDSGQVVGVMGSNRAFLWQNGELINLGVLPGDPDPTYDRYLVSKARGINNAGVVVGTSQFVRKNASGQLETVERGFIWDSVNGMRDLNSLPLSQSGWMITSAVGINDAGQIAATGKFNGNPPVALLLTPQ